MDCNIALTGFMGSGKTSVGKELRMLLPDLEFIDLDAYIEAMTGTGIPEIFESQGEEAFRNMEKMALQDIFDTNEMLGTKSVLSNLKEDCGNRPLLRSGKDLRSTVKGLMELRGPVYESAAHYIIDIDGKTPTEIAVDIITSL